MKVSVFETRLECVGELKGKYHGARRITSSKLACEFAQDQLDEYFSIRRDKEEVGVVLLSTQNKPTGYVRVSVGSLDASLVHPREVFRAAVEQSASSVLIVHNHPSGNPEPSSEDLSVTTRIVDAGEILGINVLDHIVVGDGCVVSIREKMMGW